MTQAHHLGFEDNSPFPVPAARGITTLPVEVLSLTAFLRHPPYFLHQRLGNALEYGVLGHRHHIVHSLRLEKFEHLRTGKPPVETNQHLGLGKPPAQPFENAPKYPNRPELRVRIARPQHIRKQVLLGFVVKLDESRRR